jgi:nitrate reductase assembly molybdenum cofactor insertion protein NarJ
MAAGGVRNSAASAAARWHTLAMVEQMANIGSEVERTLRAFDQGRTDSFDHALRGALELFDLTAADERWRGARRREMLRVRETFCGVFFTDPATREPGLSEYLRSYFLQFAVAARQAAGNRTR